MELFVGFLGLILFICLYFLPSIIAGSRDHKNLAPIVIVNFLIGWTFIGWVACLAWCFSYQGK